jgi:ADP-dependent NAD(P)H-hydrate dehydratase / NAD(P)H-hydrate epimerase
VIPVLTPSEMAGVDRAATEPVDVLVERAGYAVASASRRLLGGTYGKRVVVVAGPGNNGADGRVAARILARSGAAVRILEVKQLQAGERLPEADLFVDAAFGTGLSRPYSPPDPGSSAVLAVDIPSGISGETGVPVAGGDAVVADVTVTFAALKPGLLIGPGPEHTGSIEMHDIGLGDLASEAARAWLVTDADVQRMLPARPREAHKWQSAVQIVGGSPGMPGAPLLVAESALHAGAGYAWVGVPGSPPGGGLPPGEYVGHDLPAHDWAETAAAGASRAKALVVGPGLGASALGTEGSKASPVAELLGSTDLPAVVDADGVNSFDGLDAVRSVTANRRSPIVLTPHAGEFAHLTGSPPAEDRFASVREAARRSGAVVLLKGSTTVVAHPDGRVLVSTSGSSRLATAGTGDVLSGVIGAFVARGVPVFEAAALAAHVHGRAASLGPVEGLVATDLPVLVSLWLSELREE